MKTQTGVTAEDVQQSSEDTLSDPSKRIANVPPERQRYGPSVFILTGRSLSSRRRRSSKRIPERFKKFMRLHPDRLALQLVRQ
jgi:hypothetical protein